jgi:hypothetical protein
MVVLMDNDNDGHTFDAGDIGHSGDFTGATSAMQVDTSDLADTVQQLRCIAYNPQGYGFDTDTSIGLFVVIQRMLAEENLA